MGGAQAAEVVALDRTGETLTNRGAGDIDKLSGDEVLDADPRADIQ